jgi:hypothetical protein
MATCRDVITNALKLARAISPGESPSADEAEDGMRALQSLYNQFVHNGMFGELEDVYLDSDDTAEEGKRYYVPAGVMLSVPTSEYVDAFGRLRQPYDLSAYESVEADGTRAVKLYDRTEWVDLLGLGLSDTAPLSDRNEMGLAACLATNGAFAAMFGDTATMNPDVRNLARQFMGQIMGKHSSQAPRSVDYY